MIRGYNFPSGAAEKVTIDYNIDHMKFFVGEQMRAQPTQQ